MIKSRIQESNISLDGVCALVTEIHEPDENGIAQRIAESKRDVFCAQMQVLSSEYYNAGKEGIKAELKLAVDFEEYEGEDQVIFNDQRYAIYKTFQRKDDLLELFCGQKGGVK